jgi:hypothetical protein
MSGTLLIFRSTERDNAKPGSNTEILLNFSSIERDESDDARTCMDLLLKCSLFLVPPKEIMLEPGSAVEMKANTPRQKKGNTVVHQLTELGCRRITLSTVFF